MEASPVSKKQKFNPKQYDECSKQELIQIIDQLKSQISKRKNARESLLKKKKNSRKTFDFSKCKFRHIALKFLYLGWDYDGFEAHVHIENSIEEHILHALMKTCLIEDPSKSNYHKCGRTDKGVSSFSQVISITVRSHLRDDQTDDEELPYLKMLNSLLPSEIRAIAWAPVSDDFSARYSCKKRVYKYWFPLGNLDIEKMNDAAHRLVGVHDFRNLCKMDVKNGVTVFVREIFEAKICLQRSRLLPHEPVSEPYSMCELTIVGNAFLWHQIRAIVTILFLVGQKKENADIISDLLNIEKCPKKPVFGISNPLPLNLYACEFEDIDWKTNDDETKRVRHLLQSFWTSSAVKCAMLESMLNDFSPKNEPSSVKDPVYMTLFNDFRYKTYKPILIRSTEDSLDKKIEYHQKKGRLRRMRS